MIAAWFKGSWLWLAIIGVLVFLLLGQQVQVSNAKARVSRAELATQTEKRERAEDNMTRALAALDELQRLVKLVASNAQAQQEIASDLAQKTHALALADARNAALDQRMRDTAKALGTALDRADAEARAAAGERAGDQPETVYGVLAEGVRMVGEGGAVVRACRSDLARRDAEVEALTRALAADRALLDGAAVGDTASLLPGDKAARLPGWTGSSE